MDRWMKMAVTVTEPDGENVRFFMTGLPERDRIERAYARYVEVRWKAGQHAHPQGLVQVHLLTPFEDWMSALAGMLRVMTETSATITITERDYQRGWFDVEIERPASDGLMRIYSASHSVTEEQAEAVKAQVEALDPADENYRARVHIIARAKGGEYIIAYLGGGRHGRGGSGTIHRATCGQLVRKANAANGGHMYDVDITEVVERARDWRSSVPKTCQTCAKDVVLG